MSNPLELIIMIDQLETGNSSQIIFIKLFWGSFKPKQNVHFWQLIQDFQWKVVVYHLPLEML
jgi:hypothetical protein